MTEYNAKQLALNGQCFQTNQRPIWHVGKPLTEHLQTYTYIRYTSLHQNTTCNTNSSIIKTGVLNPCPPRFPPLMINEPSAERAPHPRWPGVRSKRTPHPGDTRRTRGPPSSHVTPCPKWTSWAHLHLPTYRTPSPSQNLKPAATAMLCSCLGDNAILKRSVKTWRPTRFKCSPPSLTANRLNGYPFPRPILVNERGKGGHKSTMFASCEIPQETVKRQVQLLCVLPVTPTWQHSREHNEASCVKTPHRTVQGLNLFLHGW